MTFQCEYHSILELFYRCNCSLSVMWLGMQALIVIPGMLYAWHSPPKVHAAELKGLVSCNRLPFCTVSSRIDWMLGVAFRHVP